MLLKYPSAKDVAKSQFHSLVNLLESTSRRKIGSDKAKEINSPIESILGISFRLAAVIEAEIGDFQRFSSPDKILAFAGLSPSTYQSGKFISQNATMEKRGSRYLRSTLFLAAHLVSLHSKTFASYLQKKRDEGKHYFVALSHVAKKLVRVIFHLQRTRESFLDFA